MLTTMGALKIADRATWERKLRMAMLRAKGSVPAAASALGVSRRQLERWLGEDAFSGLPRVAAGPVPGSKHERAGRCSACGGEGHNSRTCGRQIRRVGNE